MSDSAAPPLNLGPGESEIKPMETEGGGLTVTPAAERGRKRSPSHLTLSEDEDLSEGDDEWLLSDSGEDEDQEGKGIYRPFTVDDIPRPSCDHKQQIDVMYKNPETKVRGPLPIKLFPAFKSGKHVFGSDYNLADKSQISLDSVDDCSNECCWCYPMGVLQFVDIKIAGYRHTHPGRVKIYGFIAARESQNPLRNYVYWREIENCESVPVKQKTGVARLSPTGPARVISMITRSFIEFEIHARNEDETDVDDDLIIEGCTEIDNFFESKSFIDHRRFYGERCALDIKYIVMINAVQALVEVTVLRLNTIPGGVNMKLYAKTSGFNDVIPLFQGIAPEPGVMMKFAVGVERHNRLDLYIEGSQSDDASLCWQCGFFSGYHGTNEEVAELGVFATFSVKVTWRSYSKKTWLMKKQ